MRRDVKIELYDKKRSGTGRIVVGGHDLSDAVTGFTLDLESPGNPAVLTLKLPIFDGADVDAANPLVVVPQETHDALIALGWTPPPQ